MLTTSPRSSYEFNTSTLETVGVPFKAYTNRRVVGLLGTSHHTIKFWAFESCQRIAYFDCDEDIYYINAILSPDSRQLAYTTWHIEANYKIYVCNTPLSVLASIWPAQEVYSTLTQIRIYPHEFIFCEPTVSRRLIERLLESGATRRPAVTPPSTPFFLRLQRLLYTIDPQQSMFLHHVRKLLPFLNAVPPVRSHQPRDLLDVCRLRCFLRSWFDYHSAVPCYIGPTYLSFGPGARVTTQGHSDMGPPEHSRAPSTTLPPPLKAHLRHLSSWWPIHSGPTQPSIVDVPLAPGQSRVLPVMTITRYVTKTLTLIHNSHPQLGISTLENIEAAGCVSASSAFAYIPFAFQF
ncbi:uncharacterized protein EDB91DRAFT_1295020 [Suillus paluster]|uniref:uncharacterized protein n=1 Tax=Suillus paluster TaxID=48578 RepID=UPI001B886F8E|nr:uncharacterized protein EDB91DRAFT_1295020 [Suillus paluster]KAG1735716.1 hypothetical protein EDB91DRAFT_1295020 [Suillus paluster]